MFEGVLFSLGKNLSEGALGVMLVGLLSGSGFRVWGSGFRVQGSGFRV